jgi:hypothetical protein
VLLRAVVASWFNISRKGANFTQSARGKFNATI